MSGRVGKHAPRRRPSSAGAAPVLLAAIVALGPAAAQQRPEPGAGGGVTRAAPRQPPASAESDLRFSVVDLALPATDLRFATGEVALGEQELRFAAEDLVQVRASAAGIALAMPADLLFDGDGATLRPAAQAALRHVAEVIRQNPGRPVRIESHTDGRTADPYVRLLSERRAKAVLEWLTDVEGLRGVRFAAQDLGASRPVAPNARPDGSDDPEGRERNRRVEIVIAPRRG